MLYRFWRLLLVCTLAILSMVSPTIVRAATSQAPSPVQVLVFVRTGCAHCVAEKKYLSELMKKDHGVTIIEKDLDVTPERAEWEEFTTKKSITKVTPITVIGDQYIIGFDTAETTGKLISSLIVETRASGQKLDLASARPYGESQSTCDQSGLVPCTVGSPKKSQTITLPLIGSIKTDAYPIIVLAALLGFFDGFNPCAMWVLVSFLVILVQIGDRRRMFLFAGTFIFAEAIMYYLILTVWYKTWDFVRLDTIVTPIVGVLSIFGGVMFLREWRKKELACKVTSFEEQAKTRARIKELATKPFTFLTFLGILGVAFSVNIIEFACSVGIPQAFTKILDINHVGFISSQVYIFIYILMYMVDDFVVFGVALYSFEKLSLTHKYSKISNLLGGIVMVILGLLLIFKPSILQFG